MAPSIGVAIITHHARDHLVHCMGPLLKSPLCPKILVVNSSSQDGTVEEAQRLGAETLVIPRSSFNHGTTREQARKQLKTDIVVMMTPDAYPTDVAMLERLIDPLVNRKASLAYARQIPHQGADLLESFPRMFNYPAEGHIRSLDDLSRFGVYTFFCSNSCGAYCSRALDSVGGFPSVLLGEDTLVAAQLLQRGHKIAYVAEAVVRHSHRYTLWQEFRRHFDTGYARKKHGGALNFGVKDSRRGRQYLKELMLHTLAKEPWRLPHACLHILAKWAGYQCGRMGTKAPIWVIQNLSSQDYYWKQEKPR